MKLNIKLIALPIIAVAVLVSYENCAGNNGGGGGSGSASTVSSQLASAELVRKWQSPSTGAILTINADGSFTNPTATFTGNITTVNATSQSQCPAGNSSCGIFYANVAVSPGGSLYPPVGTAICSYETYSYNLMLNCGGGAAASQLYQWAQ